MINKDSDHPVFQNVEKNVRSAGNSKNRRSRPLTSKGNILNDLISR